MVVKVTMDSTKLDQVVSTLHELDTKLVRSFLDSVEQYFQTLQGLRDECTRKSVYGLELILGQVDSTYAARIKPLALFRQQLWELLHVVHWQKTPLVYRSLFGEITCLLVTASFLNNPGVELEKLMFVADMGLLLGTPDSSDALNKILSVFSNLTSKNDSKSQVFPVTKQKQISILHDLLSKRTKSIPIESQLSVLEFYEQYFQHQLPVILIDCADDWPALSDSSRNWQNLQYILDVAGRRIVPIEIGQTYLSEDAGTKLISIDQFVNQYVLNGAAQADESVGYLAQHELLEQIPDLKRDIGVPDYCSLLLDEEETQDDSGNESSFDLNQEMHGNRSCSASKVMIQAWFGPMGTTSPLHFDAYHNILVQLSGYKYIRLYSPQESSKLYPMTGKMKNNSQIDLKRFYQSAQVSIKDIHAENDYSRLFPLAMDANYCDFIIGPGDMVYIPKGWWHYIQSVDEETACVWEETHLEGGFRRRPLAVSNTFHSFSLSFWWGQRFSPSQG